MQKDAMCPQTSVDFTLFADLQKDVSSLVSAQSIVSLTERISHIFVKNFNAISCNVFLSCDSIDYAFNPQNGSIVSKKSLTPIQNETKYIIELGNSDNNATVLLEFAQRPSNVLDQIIKKIAESISKIFTKMCLFEKLENRDILGIVIKLQEANSVLKLSEELRNLKDIFDCDSISPLLVAAGKIHHLTFARIAPFLTKTWDEHKETILKGDDVFTDHLIITSVFKNHKPTFLLVSSKKNSKFDQFDSESYKIQKSLTPAIDRAVQRIYKKNIIAERRDSRHKIEQMINRETESLLTLDTYVPDLGNHAKDSLLMQIANKLELFKLCKLSTRQISTFITAVHKKYRNNPYHNWSHAVDVTRNVFIFLKSSGFLHDFDGVERLAMFAASICHDVDHRGVTNKQLEEQNHPLGILYKGLGVLEMHHCAEMINLLEEKPNKETLISYLCQEDTDKFWKIAISMISATNMANYKNMIQQINEMLQRGMNINLEEDRMLLLKYFIVCGDLSNVLGNFNCGIKWAKLLQKETRNSLGIKEEIDMKTLAGIEIGFIKGICISVYDIFPKLSQHLSPYFDSLNDNLNQWQELSLQY